MYFQLQQVERICKDLHHLIYRDRQAVSPLDCQMAFYAEPEQADQGTWQTFGPNDRWGGMDRYAWFRAELAVPDHWAGRKVLLEVSVDLDQWHADSRQFILFVDGKLQQGMDINHRHALLWASAPAGARCRIDLQAYAGLVDKQTTLTLQLVTEDESVKRLYYDLHVPCQVAAELPEGDKDRLDILDSLNRAIRLIDLRKPYSKPFSDSLARATAYLADAFYGKMCGQSKALASAVGHTHIDVAWLWTLDQTRKKTARSFATVLQLMDQYPDYVFMSSQPQLYQFLQQDYPEVFGRVRERVAEGRWETEGGMWVEADCNLTSGESLVRQFLYGKRFFREQFGTDNRILWLPDVFGYSAALPQIMKKAGIDYFMTTKINWNQYNQIPADTFWWEGIDGSAVLAHFITTAENSPNPGKSFFSTYNGYLAPAPVMRGYHRYQEKQIHDEILVAYGYGDGGGGTTEDMIERGRRMAAGIPGCPQVRMETARQFFDRALERLQDSPWLKRWVGELYFEYHRGTYTSMARNKRDNRRSELLYQDAEMLAAWASLVCGQPYPAGELAQGWEKILLNQFHDILPGSSIEAVYEDSSRDYHEILSRGQQIRDQALDRLVGRIGTDRPTVVVFNTIGFDRSAVAQLPWPAGEPLPSIQTADGQPVPVQLSGDRLLLEVPDVPAKGYLCLPLAEKPAGGTVSTSLRVAPDHLENRFWSIELDGKARICGLYDKMNRREVLQPGSLANVLRAYEDKPMGNDNWDIDIYYQQKSWEIDDLAALEVVEDGPVRAGLRITRKYQDSTLVQTIYLYDQNPRIDFSTWIDWKEDETLLKVEFPVQIHADQASFDIQFGNITRPTHWNTSWDWARFEVCAHKWADLSEEGYGVSLLNDCKYGYDIRGQVMRLTLLKSGNNPNPHADREEHRFTYALLPHQGTWRQADTVRQAYSLNVPLIARFLGQSQPGSLPAQSSLFKVDADHVVLETVKQAEDGRGLVVRLYEYKNRRGPVTLHCAWPISQVEACNLLEEPCDERVEQLDDRQIGFAIKPYEIKSLRIVFST